MHDATASFLRLREIFERVVALDAAAREAAIVSDCAGDPALERELRAMIAAHEREAGHTGDTRARLLDEGTQAMAAASGTGERVGPFELREVLGRGGMGVVYRAERVDGEVRQHVAVKVLQRMHFDEAGVRRFAQERDIVAQLAHPNIARLFDAGATRDGSPYYAMELVDGQPITTWCEGRKLALAGRLELFLKVCDAVRFAHANLVLHRDIKPGNVLVDANGEPKLIDFGIAKSMSAVDTTVTGLQMFSPGNAAPEQFRGERCGVACDVYQLGTLLYELLTGRTILGDVGSAAGIEAAILDQVPERPSEVAVDATRRSQLRGDLDAVVMRALRKEPEGRHASVEQLADDIRRFQRNEPIGARGGDRAYRVRKFVRRHRGPLMVVALAASLVATFGATLLVKSRQLERERDTATAELDRAQAVTHLLTRVFTPADPDSSLDRNQSIGTVLDRGRQLLDESMVEDPALRLQMLGVLAVVYSNIEDDRSATHLVDEGLRIIASPQSVDDRTAADFLERAALARSQSLDPKSAELVARAAVAIHDRLGDPPSRQWYSRRTSALSRMSLGDTSIWKQESLALLRYMESDPHIDPLLRAEVRVFVANRLTWGGATELSVPMLRETLGGVLRGLPADHQLVLHARYALGVALVRSNRSAEGIQWLQSAIDGWSQQYGPDSVIVARALARLGQGQLALGRFDAAERTGMRVLAVVRKLRRWPHFDHQVAETLLAEVYLATDRWALSERYFRDSLRTNEAFSGPDSANIVRVRRGLAIAILHQDRPGEAADVLEPARKLVDFSTSEHADWALAYAEVLHRLERDDEALELLDRLVPYVASRKAEGRDLATAIAALRAQVAVSSVAPSIAENPSNP